MKIVFLNILIVLLILWKRVFFPWKNVYFYASVQDHYDGEK